MFLDVATTAWPQNGFGPVDIERGREKVKGLKGGVEPDLGIMRMGIKQTWWR